MLVSFLVFLFADVCTIQGLNTKKGFDVKVAAEVSKLTGYEFKTAPNKVSTTDSQ